MNSREPILYGFAHKLITCNMPRFIITRLHWNDKETIVEKIFEKYSLDVSRTLLKCAEICV